MALPLPGTWLRCPTSMDVPREHYFRPTTIPLHGTPPMCRNIRPLFNFEPVATPDEVRDAALQFVRKVSGFTRPSQANAPAFDRAVDEVSEAVTRLLESLETSAPPNDRETEARKRRERFTRRQSLPDRRGEGHPSI